MVLKHIRKLDQFDLLLTMDGLDRQLWRTLLWKCGHSNDDRRSGGDDLPKRLKHDWSFDQFQELFDANSLDVELWSYAMQLVRSDLVVFEHPAFNLSSTCAKNSCIVGCQSHSPDP